MPFQEETLRWLHFQQCYRSSRPSASPAQKCHSQAGLDEAFQADDPSCGLSKYAFETQNYMEKLKMPGRFLVSVTIFPAILYPCLIWIM